MFQIHNRLLKFKALRATLYKAEEYVNLGEQEETLTEKHAYYQKAYFELEALEKNVTELKKQLLTLGADIDEAQRQHPEIISVK